MVQLHDENIHEVTNTAIGEAPWHGNGELVGEGFTAGTSTGETSQRHWEKIGERPSGNHTGNGSTEARRHQRSRDGIGDGHWTQLPDRMRRKWELDGNGKREKGTGSSCGNCIEHLAGEELLRVEGERSTVTGRRRAPGRGEGATRGELGDGKPWLPARSAGRQRLQGSRR